MEIYHDLCRSSFFLYSGARRMIEVRTFCLRKMVLNLERSDPGVNSPAGQTAGRGVQEEGRISESSKGISHLNLRICSLEAVQGVQGLFTCLPGPLIYGELGPQPLRPPKSGKLTGAMSDCWVLCPATKIQLHVC